MSSEDEKSVANPEEIKKETKNESNDTCLYACECKMDSYEYKIMAKYFPQIYWSYVIWGTRLNLIFSAIVAIVFRSLVATLIFFAIYQIYLMILYKVRLEYFAEKTFNKSQRKGLIDNEIRIEFYDTYFIRKGEVQTIKMNYSDIVRYVETDTNFYLKFGKRNLVTIIQKNACDLELTNFIREKFKDLENRSADKPKFKNIKEYNNPDLIQMFMVILFVITIGSLWGALWTMRLVDEINPQHGFNLVKNSWVYWCWLPVPLSSIILGFKYKNAGFKCTKNIVSGFIVGFLLLSYGSFSLVFPTFSQDYSKLDAYRNVIDAQLPDEGELEILDSGIYFDEDKTNYIIINVYYDKEDVRDLVSSIENSSNWILSKEIRSELKILIPPTFRPDDDAYYSIYNKTTNQYNALPEASGNYEIYVMQYDKSNKHLEIHKFDYSFISTIKSPTINPSTNSL